MKKKRIRSRKMERSTNIDIRICPEEKIFIQDIEKLAEIRLKPINKIEYDWNNGLIIRNGHIEELGIFKTEMTELPESIGELKFLKTLLLASNKLSKIPKSFCKLRKLEILGLQKNSLRVIGSSIGNLENLKTLNLRGNQLTTLPDSIKNLKKLEILAIGQNKFEKIPEEIATLPNLRKLGLCHNPWDEKYTSIVEKPVEFIQKTILNWKKNRKPL